MLTLDELTEIAIFMTIALITVGLVIARAV